MKHNSRTSVRRLILALGLAANVIVAAGAQAQNYQFFRIGTGSTAGTYFQIGEALAQAISRPPGAPPCEHGAGCGVEGLIAVTQTSAGSLANIEAIGDLSFDSGLAQGELVHWSYYGDTEISQIQHIPDLRVIANLYRESVHLVVRKDSGINAVQDLRGKRVSLDRQHSGTFIDALLILDAYGLNEQDIIASFNEQSLAADQMLAGTLDAFFFIGGYPAPGIVSLAERGIITLIPITGAETARLQERHSFFVADRIPAGTYGNALDVPTLSVGAQWVVNAAADEDLIYQITRALWHPDNRETLDQAHPQGRQIRFESALFGVSTELHPGAERYYLEAVMKE